MADDPIDTLRKALDGQKAQAAAVLDDLEAAVHRLRSILAIGEPSVTLRGRTRASRTATPSATAAQEAQEAATAPRRRGRAAKSSERSPQGRSTNGRRTRSTSGGTATATPKTTRRRKTAVEPSPNGLVTVDLGRSILDLVTATDNKNLAEPIASMVETRRGRGSSCRLALTQDQVLSLAGTLDRLITENAAPSLRPRLVQAREALGG